MGNRAAAGLSVEAGRTISPEATQATSHAGESSSRYQEERDCKGCGKTVPCVPGRCPREFCDDCRKFRAYLNAAKRHLENIHFRDSARAKIVRADLMDAANKVRVPKRRDRRGRFAAGS